MSTATKPLFSNNYETEFAKAREDTKQLYTQIESLKRQIKDTQLVQMAGTIPSIQTNSVNLSPVNTLRGHSSKIADIKWSQDSKTILSAAQDGFLIIWDSETGLKKNAVPLDSQWVLSCAYSPSGSLVASAGLNNNCTIYRVNEKQMFQQRIAAIFKGHTCYISQIDFLRNESIVTASGDMTCALWDIPRSKRVSEFVGHMGDVLTLSKNPADPNTFFSGGSDGYARVWDVRTSSSVSNIFVSGEDITSTAYFNNGYSFVTGSDDGIIRLFDTRSDCQLEAYSLSKAMSSASSSGMTMSRDLHNTQPRSPVSYHIDTQGIESLCFSCSGRLLFACYSEYGCIVWDTLKATVLTQLQGHGSRVTKVSSSPDGLGVCTASWDATIRIWSPNYNN